jgi:tetratricopeptide (TPR) repeat protein
MGGFFKKSKGWEKFFEEGMRHGTASDFSRAEASFREAVRLAPEEPYPHYQLGFTLALVGRHEEALEEYRRTEHLFRGFFTVETEIYLSEQVLSGLISDEALNLLRSLQWIVDDGGAQSEDAVNLSREVIELAPECALGHFHLGKALLDRDPRGAEAALRRCIELEPDDTTAINAKDHLGFLRKQAGDEDEARRTWDAMASDHAGHPRLAVAFLSQSNVGG